MSTKEKEEPIVTVDEKEDELAPVGEDPFLSDDDEADLFEDEEDDDGELCSTDCEHREECFGGEEDAITEVEDVLQSVEEVLSEICKEFNGLRISVERMEKSFMETPQTVSLDLIVEAVLVRLKALKNNTPPPKKKRKQPPGRPIRKATKTRLPPKQVRAKRAVKKDTSSKPSKSSKKKTKK